MSEQTPQQIASDAYLALKDLIENSALNSELDNSRIASVMSKTCELIKTRFHEAYEISDVNKALLEAVLNILENAPFWLRSAYTSFIKLPSNFEELTILSVIMMGVRKEGKMINFHIRNQSPIFEEEKVLVNDEVVNQFYDLVKDTTKTAMTFEKDILGEDAPSCFIRLALQYFIFPVCRYQGLDEKATLNFFKTVVLEDAFKLNLTKFNPTFNSIYVGKTKDLLSVQSSLKALLKDRQEGK